jgi:5-carboxymethyl-2-hydroxymuconate isomerase
MPHFIIECSESIVSLAKPDELMRSVYAAAESTGLFASSGVGGIKDRLHPYRHFANVDAHEHFVHVFANIMEGRTQEQKKALRKSRACAQEAATSSRPHLDEHPGL